MEKITDGEVGGRGKRGWLQSAFTDTKTDRDHHLDGNGVWIFHSSVCLFSFRLVFSLVAVVII